VKNSSKATVEVSYDRDALEKKIHNLQAVKAEQTPPTSAYPKFNGTEYEVEPEVTGTEVNQDLLREKVHQYISEFQPELDMVAENCYALPKYTSESGDVRAACNEMNEYLKASITYSMDQPVVVDKTLISNWVSADENMKVTFDEAAVREWNLESSMTRWAKPGRSHPLGERPWKYPAVLTDGRWTRTQSFRRWSRASRRGKW
jgi:vancomycin resistance protein YoaR